MDHEPWTTRTLVIAGGLNARVARPRARRPSLWSVCLAAVLALLGVSCGDGDGLVDSPTLTPDISGDTSRPVYDVDQFYASTGVVSTYVPRYEAENSYDITLRGFVGNNNLVSLPGVRVVVQLFGPDDRQVGIAVMSTTPSTLPPAQFSQQGSLRASFSQYSATFGPYADPGLVRWYRVTPYSERGRGIPLEQTLGL